MKHAIRLSPRRLAAGAALLLLASFAQAQYVWIDAKGVRQYSDRPPPPNTPAAKILKSPRPLAEAPYEAPIAAPATQAAPAQTAAPTVADREADYRKRSKERSEQQAKATDEGQRKQALAEDCASARQYKMQLESGGRITAMGENGERAYISDEERAKRLAKTNAMLARCAQD